MRGKKRVNQKNRPSLLEEGKGIMQKCIWEREGKRNHELGASPGNKGTTIKRESAPITLGGCKRTKKPTSGMEEGRGKDVAYIGGRSRGKEKEVKRFGQTRSILDIR